MLSSDGLRAGSLDHCFRGLDQDEKLIALLELHGLNERDVMIEASSPMAVCTITSKTTLPEVTDLTFPGTCLRVLIMPPRHYILTDITEGKKAEEGGQWLSEANFIIAAV